MALAWKTVRPEHVAEACELVASGKYSPRVPARSIFILRDGMRLPAKYVLRIAYCIANSMPLNAYVDFSSGERHAQLLRDLGFEVERRGSSADRRRA